MVRVYLAYMKCENWGINHCKTLLLESIYSLNGIRGKVEIIYILLLEIFYINYIMELVYWCNKLTPLYIIP